MFLTSAGLEIPTLEAIRIRMAEEQRAAINPLLANDSDSLLGSLNAIVASHDREGWEALAEVAPADPADHEGVQLESLAAITGTIKQGPTRSRFGGTRRLSVLANPGGTVTAGVTQFRVTGATPPIIFTATETVTNSGAVDATLLVAAECADLGPVAANANTVTTIHTPTAGLVSVNNTFDVVKGFSEDTDEQLRARRESEIRNIGSTSTGATLAAFLAYQDEDGGHPVLSGFALENTTDAVDPVTGLSPHRTEFVLWDGAAAPVPNADLDAILEANRPGGNPSGWVRATARDLEVSVQLYHDSTFTGIPAVKTAIVNGLTARVKPENGQGTGRVEWSHVVRMVLAVPGVVRVEFVDLRWDGDPAYLRDTDLVPVLREIAVPDSTLVAVAAVAV